MSSFQTAFKSISGLVKDFKSNENFYSSSNYSEADVRNDFINKFFIALGWDVRHETQKNPYEQEVRVEKPVQVAKAQKRADFTFYLAPNFRDVKFFVEAKKPYHDLENKDYFFQTIRYGWNANTPIAILTDFEEFIILDCRYRPDIKDILNSKIKSFHYSDYANEEKFREIFYLFSRESVLDNSIEKYAENLPKPRGKAVQRGLFKGGFQSIDESFLEELDEIRTALAKSFKKNNSHLTSEELTEATQRTIDRLVFIKFLEDKLIEPHHFVSEFGNRRTAWEDFITASITLDAKYNGVVFKKSLIDSKNIIEPDDKTFSNICEELSHDNTPYNFDAIPIHILGSIYERFLGKVVNATDKRVTIEEKPEVRKAGGVYYTPHYIVNYIVENTIGKLIEGKTPKEISKLRFADIACGSGSFLITVYERILDYHKRWYLENPEQAKKDGCIFFEGAYRLSLQQKQKILTNNVFGVDLDHQAVEVTQLSLYLKLLEDETTATANDTWVMFKEKLLPNLNKNIVSGNSLIGTDILAGNLFNYDEEKRLKPMDFETAFPEIFKSGGFDAIVGNPPYVRPHRMDEILKKYLWENYKTFVAKSDLYSCFMERGIMLCKQGALFSFIVPQTWTSLESFFEIRKLIINKSKVLELVQLPKKVFKNATVETCLFLLEINPKKKNLNNKIEVFHLTEYGIISRIRDYYQSEIEGTHLHNFQLYGKNQSKTLLNKLSKLSKLEDFVEFKYGFKTADDEKFISTKKLSNEYKPFIRSAGISRYYHEHPNEFVWYRPDLMVKHRKTARPGEAERFENEKIIVSRMGKSIVACYDSGGLYVKDAMLLVNKSGFSLIYFLGLLNSSLINYYYKEFFITIDVLKNALLSIPIPQLHSSRDLEKPIYKNLVDLVHQMISAKENLAQVKTENDINYLERKCEALDNQIDKIVYELYGLTEEEIKIVEGSN